MTQPSVKFICFVKSLGIIDLTTGGYLLSKRTITHLTLGFFFSRKFSLFFFLSLPFSLSLPLQHTLPHFHSLSIIQTPSSSLSSPLSLPLSLCLLYYTLGSITSFFWRSCHMGVLYYEI